MDPKRLTNLAQAAARAVSGLEDKAQELIGGAPGEDPKEPVGQKPAPVKRKVMVVIYSPPVPSEKGRKLSQVMGWNDPDDLVPKHIADLREVSSGYANYEVVERHESSRFPVKVDGFAYTADQFVKAMRAGAGFHDPDAVDYYPIVNEFHILDKVKQGTIDEVWLFAFPYAGFYESIMGGPGAFWCNAPELKKTEAAGRRFVIMGYNYQRGAGEMLENQGHRAESILTHVFRHKKGADNLWERFGRYDKKSAGQAEVGVVHYAPNSQADYDWGNKSKVKSRSHLWKNFPNLDGEPKVMDTADWGGGEIRAHHVWWFKLMPHITGNAGGISYNWWKYIIDPQTVR